MLPLHGPQLLDLADPAARTRLARAFAPGVVVVAPHCDDGPYSIAGTMRALGEAGVEQHMLTIFGRSGYAPNNPELNEDSVTALRNAEDVAAAKAIHPRVAVTCLDNADITVRRGLAPEEVIDRGPLDADSAAWAERAADAIEAVRDDGRTVLAPLGIGWHVDHRIVTAAAVRLARRGVTVHFFEDLPYAGWIRPSRRWLALALRWRQVGLPLRPVDVRIPGLLALKKSVYDLYRSQAQEAYWRGIAAQTERRNGAERLWLARDSEALQ